MSLKEILQAKPELTINLLQDFQREYDRRFVDDGFKGFGKARHTYAHMGNLLGRLAKYVQEIEDGEADFSSKDIEQKVIPDLLVYSAWLADVFGVNIEEAYIRRISDNIKRLHKDKISAEELREFEEYVNKRLEKTG